MSRTLTSLRFIKNGSTRRQGPMAEPCIYSFIKAGETSACNPPCRPVSSQSPLRTAGVLPAYSSSQTTPALASSITTGSTSPAFCGRTLSLEPAVWLWQRLENLYALGPSLKPTCATPAACQPTSRGLGPWLYTRIGCQPACSRPATHQSSATCQGARLRTRPTVCNRPISAPETPCSGSWRRRGRPIASSSSWESSWNS